MAYKKTKQILSEPDQLPKIILMKSENPLIDGHKKSEEIRYYLTQIILLADKIGRPLKEPFPEVDDAA